MKSEVRGKCSAPVPVAGAGCDEVSADPVAVASVVRRAVLGRLNAPTVLAVSGGPDSFALLAAAARWAPDRIAAVATFDHGTGTRARDAVERVVAWCAARDLPVQAARAAGTLARTEAAWRHARWRFLHDVASALHAPVATAHTRDDQVETVCMRVLRDAGPRGLAGLAAPGAVLRPFLALDRATVHAFAAAEGLPVVHDPANDDPAFLRSRVRHALLPALRRHDPGIETWLVALGARAAAWREDLARWCDARGTVTRLPGGWHVPDAWFEHAPPAAVAHLWAEALARCGVVADRRGTERLVPFTTDGRLGGTVPLPGGIRVRRDRDGWFVSRVARGDVHGTRATAVPDEAALVPPRLAWGQFWFQYGARASGPWSARLPRGATPVLRAWRPGDRIAAPVGTRRVVRFFQEERIPATQRRAWPVITIGDVIVWVPGVAVAAGPGTGDRGDWWTCERVADG